MSSQGRRCGEPCNEPASSASNPVMHKAIPIIGLSLSLVAGIVHAASSTQPAAEATGDWSEAVDGGSNLDGSNTQLRGRLLLVRKLPRRLDDGKMCQEAVLYLELMDASDSVGNPMRIHSAGRSGASCMEGPAHPAEDENRGTQVIILAVGPEA